MNKKIRCCLFSIVWQQIFFISYVVFMQSVSHVRLSATPWIAHLASLSFTISQSLLKLMSVELVMLSNHLSSVISFSFCPQSFPASGSFPMSWLFTSDGQSVGNSASVLPMNIHGWFPLGLTGLISLQSTGISRVFSSTTIRNHQFFSPQPSLRSSSQHLHMTIGKM